MILYSYSKCSTCQKALRFLEKKKIAITLIDIKEQPPSFEEMQKMLHFQNGKVTKLLNTSGQLYREMQLSKNVKEMPLPEILKLLSSHGMLVKRPFLLGEDFGLVGFNEAEWAQKLKFC
jgi:arsenate reductase